MCLYFVTTDLAARISQHLIFDRMLQYTGRKFSLSRHLASITDKFIEALSKETNAPEEVRTKAIEQYFQVAQALSPPWLLLV